MLIISDNILYYTNVGYGAKINLSESWLVHFHKYYGTMLVNFMASHWAAATADYFGGLTRLIIAVV